MGYNRNHQISPDGEDYIEEPQQIKIDQGIEIQKIESSKKIKSFFFKSVKKIKKKMEQQTLFYLKKEKSF